jgi:hypothetical protein
LTLIVPGGKRWGDGVVVVGIDVVVVVVGVGVVVVVGVGVVVVVVGLDVVVVVVGVGVVVVVGFGVVVVVGVGVVVGATHAVAAETAVAPEMQSMHAAVPGTDLYLPAEHAVHGGPNGHTVSVKSSPCNILSETTLIAALVRISSTIKNPPMSPSNLPSPSTTSSKTVSPTMLCV